MLQGNAEIRCTSAERSAADKPFIPIVSEIGDDSFDIIDDVNGKFLIQTNHEAPNGKIAIYDPANRSWKDIVPERSEPIAGSSSAGGKLFIGYLKDVTTREYVFSLDGKLENEMQLPDSVRSTAFPQEGRQVHLLQLHFLQLSTDDFQIRHRHQALFRVSHSRHSQLQGHRLRSAADFL
jgi:prolyl oligopeptidase PreP (S9A serine peptidase family)